MFRSISQRVTARQDHLAQNNSKQEVLNSVISKFFKETIGLDGRTASFNASIQKGNLYISVPSKSVTNEIVFRAKHLYAALKKNRIICNNLIIR
ncbi:MAG: hypothetical protein A2941_02105 [Candidatus Yanofskybacteria bacterium RIFCSPLOWO2_01_FULL_49_17]|uniref:DUF721 domain-containing protein n=1 Tax=Candidatus Yanofskybacteria bacterium RIFCSPLOWO2_01_FULL_49_17 TaxID=1802700 RepID=A0A1F8GUH5_9BACT|nr:MAG: hypothetical protein A2941_02105 [Candidatus Yanofskybacteria bacterium RIFCSPLOWO2_01_FULL_49_17]